MADSATQQTKLEDKDDQDKQNHAATILQNQFRKYQRDREDNGLNLTASARWHEAIKEQNFKTARRQSHQGDREDTQSRWKRAGVFTSGLVDTGPKSPSAGSTQLSTGPLRPKKTMDTTYWLEMVDHKHRYGSNLKAYHTHWNTQYQGDQNFFYWLDHGEGRHVDLQESPRERLDSERITYLNAEQRLNYLIKIVDGKNGVGQSGCDPEEFEAAKQRGEIPSSDSDSSLSSGASSVLSRDAHHYAQAGPKKSGMAAKVKSHIDPKAIMDNLLRKTLNANTWIFVLIKPGYALFMIGALEQYAHFTKKKGEIKSKIKKLLKHGDHNAEAQAIEKEKHEDRPAQLAAERISQEEKD
ncbi:hypothetical protein H4Q26_000641 [Puccinia striiformis f. sp. tritici PST-130]|nr:hypothetical protein H4Q26_000641 [Puccinia striiformis f. sp. tritici PST-130]